MWGRCVLHVNQADADLFLTRVHFKWTGGKRVDCQRTLTRCFQMLAAASCFSRTNRSSLTCSSFVLVSCEYNQCGHQLFIKNELNDLKITWSTCKLINELEHSKIFGLSSHALWWFGSYSSAICAADWTLSWFSSNLKHQAQLFCKLLQIKHVLIPESLFLDVKLLSFKQTSNVLLKY